jgi:hypothetical protein
MSEPLKYLAQAQDYFAQAQDCLRKAADAPNAEARQRWLDYAESWLGMVPQDLCTLTEIFEKTVRDKSTQQELSKMWH